MRRFLDHVLMLTTSAVFRNRVISFYCARAQYQGRTSIFAMLSLVGVLDRLLLPDWTVLCLVQEIAIFFFMWGVCRLRDRDRILFYLRCLFLEFWILQMLEFGFLDFGDPLLSGVVSSLYGLPIPVDVP